MAKCKFWLKLDPDFVFKGGRQIGWKAVGITQNQPKTGHCVYLELEMDFPPQMAVHIPEASVKVGTEADKILEELDNGV